MRKRDFLRLACLSALMPNTTSMYVNLNTARALGLEVPTSMLATADVVIE